MRVLLYNDRLDPALGGPVSFVVDLARALAAEGHEARALVDDRAGAPSGWGANPALIDRPRADDALSWAQIAHISGVWVPGAARLADACRRAALPYVLSLHGVLNPWPMAQQRLKKRLYLIAAGNRLLRGAGAIHCTSEGEKAHASRWAPPDRLAVVPPLIDLSPAATQPDPEAARRAFPALRAAEPVVLFVGRLHPVKGVERLIAAAALLSRPARIVIAGDGEAGYAASLRRQAAESGARVEFLGFVGPDVRPSLYAAADLFVLPSRQENFGLVLFESLAAGTPVLTTRHVDTWPELVEHGRAIIAGDAPAELARAIDEALADRQALAARGEAGRAWVLASLGRQALVDRYLEMYRSAGARA